MTKDNHASLLRYPQDGPVARAVMNALETGNINYVLIWVPGTSIDEIRTAFARALAARKTGPLARDVADDSVPRERHPPPLNR